MAVAQALVVVATTFSLLATPVVVAAEELGEGPVSEVSESDVALDQPADAGFAVTDELAAADPALDSAASEVVPEEVAPEEVAPDVAPAVPSDVAPALVAAPVDSDGDGLTDDEEAAYGTNAFAVDTDSDGVSDLDEISVGTDPLTPNVVEAAESAPVITALGDSTANTAAGTDLIAAPTPTPHDPVLFPPQQSVAGPYSPGMDTSVSCPPVCDTAAPAAPDTDTDSDGDGLFDAYEVSVGLNPQSADSDGDGQSDYDELNQADQATGADPGSGDADGDGLSDGYEEQVSLTNPSLADTDRDGMSDGKEINLKGSDPLNPDSDNDGKPDSCDDDPWVFDTDDGETGALFGGRMGCSSIALGTPAPPSTNQFDGTSTLEEARTRGTIDGATGDWLGTQPAASGLDIFDEVDERDPNLEGYPVVTPVPADPATLDFDRDGLSHSDEIQQRSALTSSVSRLVDANTAGMILDFDADFDPATTATAATANLDRAEHSPADSDGDGVSDPDEIAVGTDPLSPDVAGVTERLTGGDIAGTLAEQRNNQSLKLPCDYCDVRADASIQVSIDSDRDGLRDVDEELRGADPTNPDTDSDGLLDGDEIHVYRSFPFCRDSDGDGLEDYQEVMVWETNPSDNDTDGDTWGDGVEVNDTEPNDPNSHPTQGLKSLPPLPC